MTVERHMIRLDKKPQLFTFRVAGVILHNDHLLVQRSVNESYWALPGGRAEIGETSEQTIIREMQEEIDRTVRIERLLFTTEVFFSFDDYRAHELGFYYLLKMDVPLPFHRDDIVHRVVDGPTEVLFRWVPATAATFAAFDIRPAFLGDYINRLPERVEHLIVDEDSHAH
ncbi:MULTISPECIES: NUDIX hydrolase [Rhizobium/Agrobacterium group]|uniref:NUDIX hydrolase n=1 Tax=Rhizobium/Agrobacterium group TaxID=227290 RepID=UPI000B3F8835|nr:MULTISPECIES: NUDIX domain-containing protein [Rhizobium/Agrobacterium group]MCF1482635.1 NUDIX domain-containing protein [Allorhizobium ampelinum]NSZ43722.1 NUDIX domain-containing protein [Agrobacterium vitis]NTA27469.1 NUDIX domain-containing protein [Allorhizobium ampelinum]OVE94523.1 DNA mismatch repair protein MutT [Allorhizobium ampelinum]